MEYNMIKKSFIYYQKKAQNEIKIESLGFFNIFISIISFNKLTIFLFSI